MTKQIKRTTNKLVLTYNNDTTYTIPRVTNFTVSRDGTTVSGNYDRTEEFHGITQKQSIFFTIDLKDVVEIKYIGQVGEVSKNFTVSKGRILTVTEWRT